MSSTDDDRTRDGIQTVLALVGITAGLVPLVRVLLGGEVGIFLSWIPDTDGSPGSYVAPSVVVLVALVGILVLERGKGRPRS